MVVEGSGGGWCVFFGEALLRIFLGVGVRECFGIFYDLLFVVVKVMRV